MNSSGASMTDFHGCDDVELNRLAQTIAAILLQRDAVLCTAESCTGGWIAKVLTDIAGSSAWFECGAVTYGNESKQAVLGVRAQTLARHGAVSGETAAEMVSGALLRFGATLAVAVTGIAGPTGGSPEKPVGTVWIGWKRRGGAAQTERFQFSGDREAVRRQTVAVALRGVERLLAS
ncbi:MAG: nicotinamide-nucleotide amidohydrolase family protein [Rudaea sp.]|uniref:CinA family protein n=1 Tax=Rudaea sp. TaxID=2136325 RepID=UPI0039E31DBC